jgi:hypothetical protein
MRSCQPSGDALYPSRSLCCSSALAFRRNAPLDMMWEKNLQKDPCARPGGPTLCLPSFGQSVSLGNMFCWRRQKKQCRRPASVVIDVRKVLGSGPDCRLAKRIRSLLLLHKSFLEDLQPGREPGRGPDCFQFGQVQATFGVDFAHCFARIGRQARSTLISTSTLYSLALAIEIASVVLCSTTSPIPNLNLHPIEPQLGSSCRLLQVLLRLLVTPSAMWKLLSDDGLS